MLGFVEITEAGRAGNAEYRKPNLFTLTYRRASKDVRGDGTHEWMKISEEDAAVVARLARSPRRSPKTNSQCQFLPIPSDGNRHRKRRFHSTETVTTGHGTETVTTLDISGRVAHTERQAPRGRHGPGGGRRHVNGTTLHDRGLP
jgi:hypothetical protein